MSAEQDQLIKTQEIHLVDEKGQTRMVLSTAKGIPSFQLLDPSGNINLDLKLDEQGFPAIVLNNPNQQYPSTKLEVDAKGTHLKFDHANGASNYLFLNNEGTSGLVMLDRNSERRFNILVDENGELTLTKDQ